MRAIRKRHRDTMRAVRFCRSALKLTIIFGGIVFTAMAARIIVIEFGADAPYPQLARDLIILTSSIYALFFIGSTIIVAIIYYLLKKYNISTRMFKIKDLSIFLAVQIILLLATAYISYAITSR
jgi:hypothetical protein